MIGMAHSESAAHQLAFNFEQPPAMLKQPCPHDSFFDSHAFTPAMLICGGCGYPWLQYLPNEWDKEWKQKERREYTTTDRPWNDRT